MTYEIGDIVQVRDKRDGQLAIKRAEVTGLDPETGYIQVHGDGLHVAVHTSTVEPYVEPAAKVSDGRRKARKIKCRECGETCTVHSHKALFCSPKCAKAFNVRRDNRARVVYDLVMAGRFERNKNPAWLTRLSRLAHDYREEDRTQREGRKSWYNSTIRDL